MHYPAMYVVHILHMRSSWARPDFTHLTIQAIVHSFQQLANRTSQARLAMHVKSCSLNVHLAVQQYKHIHVRMNLYTALLQGLAERNQSQSALKVRLLQSCGAHMAMCRGGSCFRTPSWRDIISVFRQVNVRAVKLGKGACPEPPQLAWCLTVTDQNSICSDASTVS